MKKIFVKPAVELTQVNAGSLLESSNVAIKNTQITDENIGGFTPAAKMGTTGTLSRNTTWSLGKLDF